MNYDKYGVETFYLIPIRGNPHTKGMSLYQLKNRVKPSYYFFLKFPFFCVLVSSWLNFHLNYSYGGYLFDLVIVKLNQTDERVFISAAGIGSISVGRLDLSTARKKIPGHLIRHEIYSE